MSAYGSNKYKRNGIQREYSVAKRILDVFLSQSLTVTMEKSSLLDDMRKKYDYKYTCLPSQSFSKNKYITEIKVDIKCGKTFTLKNSVGHNTLETSESTLIVYELFENAPKLLYINTDRFKLCIEKYPPVLKNSKERGNNSKYFFIENYIQENKDFLGNYIKYIK
jgi:hypothetical protein